MLYPYDSPGFRAVVRRDGFETFLSHAEALAELAELTEGAGLERRVER